MTRLQKPGRWFQIRNVWTPVLTIKTKSIIFTNSIEKWACFNKNPIRMPKSFRRLNRKNYEDSCLQMSENQLTNILICISNQEIVFINLRRALCKPHYFSRESQIVSKPNLNDNIFDLSITQNLNNSDMK
jgi:hypothetical protein